MTTLEQIEQIIDRVGLKALIEGIGIVCEEKAEHIMANWQDQITAAAWKRSGRAIEQSVPKIEV